MYIQSQKSIYVNNNKDIKTFLGYPENYPVEKIANDVIAYFRKSRKDEDEYRNEDIEQTLARHIKTIQEWAINIFGAPIPEKNLKKEVVSGDTIADRPVIQEVLRLAESQRYRAIVCIDVQRLGRGDLEDQGRMIKIFQFSNTKVITPNQWFDLSNKFDKKFFEQKMRESRDYLEYIKEIMGNGRTRSVLDGTWPHSVAPYGFNRVKSKNSRGFTLEYNEQEYEVCKLIVKILKDGLHLQYKIHENDTITSICKIFGLVKQNLLNNNANIEFAYGNLLNIDVESPGTSVIANYLNFLEIEPRNSTKWTPNMIRNILTSFAAHGFVSWGNRKTVVTLKDGKFLKSRPLNKKDTVIAKGFWDPIYSEEEIEAIDNYFAITHKPIRKDKEIKNPLVGLVKCEFCNSNMQRRPYYKNNKKVVKRAYDIDKNKLRLLLREKKGNLSLNNIARNLHVSKNVIDHWFTSREKYFSIPYADKWFELKKLLNINTNEFDEALTSFISCEEPHIDTLICNKHGCSNVGSDLILVENKVLETLKIMLNDYNDYIDNYSVKIKEEIKSNQESLEIINKNIETQKQKLNKLCDLLETGIYTRELFVERKCKIDLEIDNLEKKKKQLNANSHTNKFYKIQKMVPQIEHVLANYNENLTPQMKNELLSSIIKEIYYKKEKGGLYYKENFKLKIYLKI